LEALILMLRLPMLPGSLALTGSCAGQDEGGFLTKRSGVQGTGPVEHGLPVCDDGGGLSMMEH